MKTMPLKIHKFILIILGIVKIKNKIIFYIIIFLIF